MIFVSTTSGSVEYVKVEWRRDMGMASSVYVIQNITALVYCLHYAESNRNTPCRRDFNLMSSQDILFLWYIRCFIKIFNLLNITTVASYSCLLVSFSVEGMSLIYKFKCAVSSKLSWGTNGCIDLENSFKALQNGIYFADSCELCVLN
jgi:hypothetical protein